MHVDVDVDVDTYDNKYVTNGQKCKHARKPGKTNAALFNVRDRQIEDEKKHLNRVEVEQKDAENDMTDDINDVSRRDREWSDGQDEMGNSNPDPKNEASGRDNEEEQMDDQID